MMAPSKRVEFKTVDGVTLRGDYFPTDKQDAPLVVMAGGLTMLKEHFMPSWAVELQKAGIAALSYDHRGYGSSGGEPRHLTDPMQQAEDYHDAVLFARTLPSIDPSRIAIWGVGHSGGAAMIAAGDDPHVKAVVVITSFQSGAYDRSISPPGLVERAWKEREARVAGSKAERQYMPAWSESAEQAKGERGDVFLHGPDGFQFINKALELSGAAGTPWQNRLALESYYRITKTEPRDHLHKISPRALLYMAAPTDGVSGTFEAHKENFARAREPKQWVELPAPRVDEEPAHSAVSKAQLDFFENYL